MNNYNCLHVLLEDLFLMQILCVSISLITNEEIVTS